MSGRVVSCAELDDIAVDVALGTLAGPERSAAFAHLGACARCRTVMAELTDTATGLLVLAPAAEPPLGFEGRLLARARESHVLRPPPSVRWRRLCVAAVVAASVALAAAVGHVTAAGSPAGVRTAVARADGGRATCRAVVLAGDPPQLFVSIDEPAEAQPSDYSVQARPAGARAPVVVGVVHVVDGHGTLAVAMGAGLDHLEGLRVMDGDELRYDVSFA